MTCSNCGEDAIIKIKSDGDTVDYCLHCGSEDGFYDDYDD